MTPLGQRQRMYRPDNGMAFPDRFDGTRARIAAIVMASTYAITHTCTDSSLNAYVISAVLGSVVYAGLAVPEHRKCAVLVIVVATLGIAVIDHCVS